MPKIPTSKINLSFENALQRLEEITRKLETGEESLETCITLYNEGVELKNFCELKIKEAEGKWQAIKKNKNGIVEITELTNEITSKPTVPNTSSQEITDSLF